MTTFEIHHRRHYYNKNDYILAGSANTLEEAKNKRLVSGDLVVFSLSKNIVKHDGWLFDWEKADRNCYAQKAMRMQP